MAFYIVGLQKTLSSYYLRINLKLFHTNIDIVVACFIRIYIRQTRLIRAIYFLVTPN